MIYVRVLTHKYLKSDLLISMTLKKSQKSGTKRTCKVTINTFQKKFYNTEHQNVSRKESLKELRILQSVKIQKVELQLSSFWKAITLTKYSSILITKEEARLLYSWKKLNVFQQKMDYLILIYTQLMVMRQLVNSIVNQAGRLQDLKFMTLKLLLMAYQRHFL